MTTVIRRHRGIEMIKALSITRGIFCQEMRKVRVHMGYILGLAILAGELNAFLRYAAASGESVNLLESFVVTEHSGMTVQFLVLGYLLVVASAPFIKADTYLVLYRCSRRIWNVGVLLYILLQAFLYVLFLAGICAVVSCPVGILGKKWSNPVYMLICDDSDMLAMRYGIAFRCGRMVQNMTVPKAFGITFLYLFGYLVFLGVLYYLCNLVLKSFWGLIAVAAAHLGNYFLPYYPIRRPCPGYFADGRSGQWMPFCCYLAFILILSVVSFLAVKRVDMLSRAEAG